MEQLDLRLAVHKSLLLSALTFNTRLPLSNGASDGANGSGNGDAATALGTTEIVTFATSSFDGAS